MIHVDRSQVPPPDWWEGAEFRDFLATWANFHGAGGSRVQQRRIAPTVSSGDLESWKQSALPTLLKGFHGKCAYTEEPIDEKSGTVVFHRPLSDAIGLESDVSPEHYWWLLADWSNWYPASRAVASIKGTSFPVVGPRLDPPTHRVDPAFDLLGDDRDLGLLLDPCRDSPAWHLEFLEDGSVQPREHPSPEARRTYQGHSRGDIAIKAFGLNHLILRSGRKASLMLNALLARDLFALDPQEVRVSVRPSDQPFAGPARQVLAKRLVSFLSEIPRIVRSPDRFGKIIPLLAEELAAEIACGGALWPASPIPIEFWAPLRPIIHREWPELDDAGFFALVNGGDRDLGAIAGTTRGLGLEDSAPLGPDEDEPLSAPILSHLENRRVVERTERVERIEIENFKAIERLELDLSTEPVTLRAPFDPAGGPGDEIPEAVRWTTFLGENGSGKSCCLQAIGLALAADRLDELLAYLRAQPDGFSWSDTLRRGTQTGSILLRMTGGSILDLRFDANGHWWSDGGGAHIPSPPRMAAYIRGYGATRLLDGGPIDAASEHVRLANLFDPHADVLDAQAWLLGLEEGDFNVAALTLSGFLDDDRAAALRAEDPDAPPLMTREDGEILVGGDPLSYLSDGYRAVITLVCDIMAGLGAGLSDLRNATGIVLIDELGSHLHPRWKMEITARLRRELPNVQFFVSTHEPLCLRGLFGGEVIRVRKTRPERVGDGPPQPGAVSLERVERSPSDYRVDQLLTSEFFGLDTTIDPDLDRRFQAYYRLLAMTPEERAEKGLEGRMLELKTDIQSRTQPVLGFTRRDQLVYEAIDELLAREREMTPEERQAERTATLRRIQEIWKARGTVGGAGATGRVSGQGRGREPRG